MLQKLCRLFPLAPGALELLQAQCMRECKRVLAAWKRTPAREQDSRRPLNVSEFMPARQLHAPHLRLVLQITGMLMHGVRVLYVQNTQDDREAVVVVDANYVSFLAHDGQKELLFSTECASFMRMLDEALFKQELDYDFQKSRSMTQAQDFLGAYSGGVDNVLGNYVLAVSVHDVVEVAQLGFSDVFDEEDDESDLAYTAVYHELRVFDCELLDIKMPYTSLCDEANPRHRMNRLCASELVENMDTYQDLCEGDEVLLARQEARRMGDMISPRSQVLDHDRADAESDRSESPDSDLGSSDDAQTVVYVYHFPGEE